MPSGTFEKEILIKRKMADGKKLIIYRAGPFFDVELSGVRMGKVRKISTEITPEGIAQGIKVGGYRITLSPKEIEILQAVIDEREERRSMGYEEKLMERQTVKQKLADEKRARFRASLRGPAVDHLDELLALEGTPEAVSLEELNKAKTAASGELMHKYIYDLFDHS